MGEPNGVEIDHIDGDRLNNCFNNLRLATSAQNQQGFQRKRVKCTSKFRGVCWDKEQQKWRAQLGCRDRTYNLGRFHSEKDAALAYDIAARNFFGKFATPNFK